MWQECGVCTVEGSVTAQQSDILINEHPRVDLGGLHLYYLRRGDIDGDDERLALPVTPDMPEGSRNCSSLFRGYIATFRLEVDGKLRVVSYEFPYAPEGTPNQAVSDGVVTGEFWMVMRPFFSGPNTNVPFRDGQIVEDRSEWHIEDQTLNGHVTRRFKDSGLIVDVGELGPCFMPRSLLPEEWRGDLDALIGRAVGCEIFQIDEKRHCIIIRPIENHPEDSDTP